MKILVTGAAGRLGRVVCEHLLEAGHEVVGTDKSAWEDAPMRYVQADLRDFEAVAPLPVGCDAVAHLGNYPGMRTCRDGRQLFLENSAMTANVATAAEDAGVTRVVFASSVQVISGTRHGVAEIPLPSCFASLPLDGETPARPGNQYALSKVAGEEFLRMQCRYRPELAAVAVRFPMLLTHEMQGQMVGLWKTMETVHGPLPLDEGFSWLTRRNSARLIEAILLRAKPGFAAILPAERVPWAECSVAELVERYYPGVPLKRPLEELTGLVDTSAITAAYGWEPE